MAFDLLTRKTTSRDWSRDSSLVAVPALPELKNMNPLADLATRAKELDQGIAVRPSGHGATVVVKRKWG